MGTAQEFGRYNMGGVGLEGAEVLAGLGLSGRQARVYLALLKVGAAKARTVAGLTMIDRQEIYRLLGDLQQLGLVVQSVSVPACFVAVPVEDAVGLLLEQRAGELRFMSVRANRLIKKLSVPPRVAPSSVAAKPSFGTVVERDGGRRYQKAVEDAQQSIEVITSWLRFRKFCYLLEEELRGVLKNGVVLCVVTEKPPNHNRPKWVTAAALKYSNFTLKTIPQPPAAAVMLIDRAQAAIAFNVNTSLTRGPTLWTANPDLVAVCHAYFREVWAQTT